jgi:hypothetical protein
MSTEIAASVRTGDRVVVTRGLLRDRPDPVHRSITQGERMAGNPKRLRQLTVWLHVVTSVGWMALALTLFALMRLALTGTPDETVAAATIAHYMDGVLLAPLANASAATGLLLGLGTAWGLTQHRWVLIKLLITLVQLYLGIFVLSPALSALASTGTAPPLPLVVGTAAMAGAIAFQAWLSVAKPGGRTRRTGRPVKLPVAAPWVFAAAVLAPLTDIAVGTAVGFPTPLLSLLTVAVAAEVRRRTLRAPVQPRVA